MRMIDADALAEAMGVKRLMIQSWKADSAWGVPIVDAEPVVRCKDCKYWNPYKSHHYKGHFCDVVTLFVQENEYCAWGKRKGGADDGE